MEQTSAPAVHLAEPVPARSRLHRWLLVAVGVLLVGIGALGAVLPGLPTTIFLLGASWCFARSCPWLEERLIRVPLFRPFLVYLDHGAAMPRRVVAATVAVMWIAITVSVVTVNMGGQPRPLLGGLIVVLGLVGTFFVLRMGRQRQSEETKLQSAPDVKT
jgi:uncharacterized membrane protein YbaN (DUF454 family)